MDQDTVQKAYSRWSRFYDLLFGLPMVQGRRRAIEMLEPRAGQRVLEVGVGTGLSFPEFPWGCSVFGIDISRPMLERAKPRLTRPGTGVVEGDASKLPFADGTFDAALAPYVVSVVPDPAKLLEEVVRVVRPGGSIMLLNHFASDNRILGAMERAASKTTTRLFGFHAHFDVHSVLQQVGLEIVESRRVPPLQYWRALSVVSRNGH